MTLILGTIAAALVIFSPVFISALCDRKRRRERPLLSDTEIQAWTRHKNNS